MLPVIYNCGDPVVDLINPLLFSLILKLKNRKVFNHNKKKLMDLNFSIFNLTNLIYIIMSKTTYS